MFAQAPMSSVALFDGKTLRGWRKPQGVPADYRGVAKEGRIGLQIHAGKDWSTVSKVRHRNLRVTEL